MGNDSSTQSQAPPAEAPPIHKALEDDLANVQQKLATENAEKSKKAKQEAKQRAKANAMAGGTADKASADKDQKRKEAVKVALATHTPAASLLSKPSTPPHHTQTLRNASPPQHHHTPPCPRAVQSLAGCA